MGKVVFLYPTGAQGVETNGEEKAGQEVDDGFGTKGVPHAGSKGYFRQPVQRYPFVKGFDLTEAGNAENLEEGVEQQPGYFTDEIVIDQSGLPAVGQVGVQFVHSLERMMFYMIAFEGYAAGEYLGQIGQDTCQAVGGPVLEQEVVRAFMDHDKQGMVCKGSQQVGGAKNDPPGLCAYQPGQGYLKADEAKNGKDGVFVFANEVPDFRMFLKDLPGTKAMWFLFVGINEIGLP
jgi:hypothetical protein